MNGESGDIAPANAAAAGLAPRGAAIMWIVLTTGIALSALAWGIIKSRLQHDAQLQFMTTTRSVTETLEARIQSYEDLLLGLQGLFLSSDTISHAEFSDYIDNMQLPLRYPGVHSVTYGVRIPHFQKHAFEQMVQHNQELHPPGYPEFTITPLGTRSEYVALLYVEPFAGREKSYGLDLMADDIRRVSAERARDTGLPTASGPHALASQSGNGDTASSLQLALYRRDLPAFTVTQRREAFSGILSITFTVRGLAENVLDKLAIKGLHLKIIDQGYSRVRAMPGTEENSVLFDNVPSETQTPASGSDLENQLHIKIGQRNWQLVFSAPPQLFITPAGNALPWVVLLGGCVITGLLFGLIRSLTTSSRRAVDLANRITQDLRASETRLTETQRMTQELIEALPNPIFFKGTDGRYLGVNKAWETFFRIPREGFIGKTVHDLYPDDKDVADRLHAMDEELWQNPGTQVYETAITTHGRERHDAIYYKATYTRQDGSVAGLIGTIIDITERKLVEKALRESESRYRSVIASIVEGVILRDKDCRIVDCNASAQRILGRPLDQMIGNTQFDPDWKAVREDNSLFPAEERPAFMALHTGKLQSNIVMGLRRQDDTVLWLLLNSQPLFGESGPAPSGVVSTITDITQRKQVESRQAMEHAITRVLAETEALTEAIPKIIRTVCEAMDWHCGARWEWDAHTQLLQCCETWGIAAPAIQDFVAANSKRSVKAKLMDGGLVRQIYSKARPVWIADIAQQQRFRRAPLLAKAGLRGAFGFPLLLGNEVLGVMEFFHRDVREPDEMLIRIAQSIGSQIGQYMVRKHAEDAVKFVATHDTLTGLPNRVMFNQRLNHAIVQAQRRNQRLAVLFIDLDRFKVINDTLGHETGDELLREVAKRIKENLRESDTVARFGGDEFVVLTEDVSNPVSVGSLAHKLIAALSSGFMLFGNDYHVTASIGISTYPDDSRDMQTLLKNSDIAMYRAKEHGRNSFQFYSAQINTHSVERLTLESGLRRALDRGELVLHYQPQVEIASGRITGLEALVRWQHPEMGLIAPARFIQIAE
ncbi:MAG TPA: diguanylate cyclase, partial [Burkholderiales bacterium]|nr:diguanylate cyclase [Burkholderiales bacterium]